jgi:1,4-dihydroxy-2-naphthoate polyprenyltransferase
MAIASGVRKKPSPFSLKIWLLEPRPHYMLLPVVLILVGTTAASYYTGRFSFASAVLALIGLVLCHMSVNILNDYFDFKSGVDLKTIKTPFNGGSGMLPAGKLQPKQVLFFGLICLILAVPVGIYFTVIEGWQLLPLLLLGAFCVLLYTTVILKNYFPEWSPGVGLGLLPVLGAYFVQSGGYSLPAFISAMPSGFLVLNLLLLNEFPDAEADLAGRKKTLPITIGLRGAAVVYSAFTIATYAWIAGAVTAKYAFGLQGMPIFTLIALLTLPLAIKAMRSSFRYHGLQEMNIMVPAMANNVLVVLVTQALLGIGFIISQVTNV